MNTVMRRLFATGNKVTAALYRRSNGRINGKARGGLPVLLLTVPGRRTGNPRTTCVAYFVHDGGYVVVGSAGGMKEDPQWSRNLAATERARIQVGAERIDVATRMATGDEREQLWNDVVLAGRGAFFRDYETKSGRKLPIGVLTPTD